MIPKASGPMSRICSLTQNSSNSPGGTHSHLKIGAKPLAGQCPFVMTRRYLYSISLSTNGTSLWGQRKTVRYFPCPGIPGKAECAAAGITTGSAVFIGVHLYKNQFSPEARAKPPAKNDGDGSDAEITLIEETDASSGEINAVIVCRCPARVC